MGGLTCFSLMLILQFLLPFNLRAISESISLATTTLLTQPLKSHSMDVFCSGDVNQHSTGHSPSRHTTVPLKHCRSTEDVQTGADRRMPCPSLGRATSEFRAAKYCSNIGAGVKHTHILPPSSPVNHLWRERSIERQSTSDIKRVNAVKCLLAEKWEPSRLGIKHFRM